MRLSLAMVLIALVATGPPVFASTEGKRVGTLEDLYGDTGNRFQGAVGLLNLEGTASDLAVPSYGLAIDDMVIEWRELRLDSDTTDCEIADGQCAVLEVQSTNLYEGNAVISVSVLERTPYGAEGVNDCALDGDFADTGYCANTVPQTAGGAFHYPEIHTCSVASSTVECGACSAGSADPGKTCNIDSDCFGGTCSSSTACIADTRWADDTDCNDNGVPDVVARAHSDLELEGELVVLDSVGSDEYRGDLTISTLIDSPGVLHLGPIGTDPPVVTVRYDDRDDGSGEACANSVIPEEVGLIETRTTVFVEACNLTVLQSSFQDNGDGDEFADTDETVELGISVINKCKAPLTGCFARLSTNSPAIECIKTPLVAVGDLADSPDPSPVGQPFVFKVGPVNRSGLDDDFTAEFNVSIACNEIDAVSTQQTLPVVLDLSISDDGQTPMTWSEGFESGTMGAFETMNLDAGIAGNSNPEGVANADGWRCQYNDPDWVNGSSYGNDASVLCYPSNNLAQSNEVYFHADGPDGTGGNTWDSGRAFTGSFSMAYNLGSVTYADPTTPISVVDAARTTEPINLGTGGSTLGFWHQISLMDGRALGTLPFSRTADRAVVQIQLADEAGEPSDFWKRLEPFQNAYDTLAADNYFNCSFDPVDDGTTEDDFFDPTDPDRNDGPSSTCFPNWTYSCLGATIDNPWPAWGPFCNADTPPAPEDVPSWGVGAWVQSRFDLSEFQGRRVRLRFLVTSIKVADETWEAQFFDTPDPRDDGWWIDDITIDNALANPARIDADNFQVKSCSIGGATCIAQCEVDFQNCDAVLGSPCTGQNNPCIRPCGVGEGSCSGPPPGCGANCSSVTTHVFVEPAGLDNPTSVTSLAPGQVVSFDAADPGQPSFADACLSGTLQYRFCTDADQNAFCADSGDSILRNWTDNPTLSVAPQLTTTYTTEVRCSTVPSCSGAVAVEVHVACPGGVNALALADLRATSKTSLAWSGDPLDVDWVVAPLSALRIDQAGGPYGSASFSFAAGTNAVPMSSLPLAGTGDYYLVKAAGALNTLENGFLCNSRTWRSGSVAEVPETTPGRDTTLGAP